MHTGVAVKRRRSTDDTERAAKLQASWTAREPTPEDDGPWELATTRAKRRAKLKENGNATTITKHQERELLGTHVIRIHPSERCDMSKLDPAELQQIIHSMAEDPQIAKYLVLKLSRSSNALIVTTCDTKQAARLLRIQKLPLSSRPHLPVISHQVPASGMSRGVIYGCRPCETSKTLMKALDADME